MTEPYDGYAERDDADTRYYFGDEDAPDPEWAEDAAVPTDGEPAGRVATPGETRSHAA